MNDVKDNHLRRRILEAFSTPTLFAVITGSVSGALILFVGILGRSTGPTNLGWLGIYAALGYTISYLITKEICQRREIYLRVLTRQIKEALAGQEAALPTTRNPVLSELRGTVQDLFAALQDRDRMRHSLGRIMDPKIADILIKENPKVGGRQRDATILFCDIRNYTSLCEEMTPDELQEFLNDYWKGTVDIIMGEEGTIDKFHGDGVCVIFGAPNLHTDDPLRAVRTAWRLVENVDAINKRRLEQRKSPIHIGVGVHCGQVIAGHIGSERRMDYTVVGDVVNVAARIQELNKKFGTSILISDQVYEKVEASVRVKTLTLARLRGHKRPILVHALRELISEGQASTSQAA